MTITLLVDLDDTLLGNKNEKFLPAYFQALAEYFIPNENPEKMYQALQAGREGMASRQNPGVTLGEAFYDRFLPILDINKEKIKTLEHEFYSQVYPSLRNVTDIRPQAVDFIDEAISRGCRIAIATNPAYPRTATLQRLDWAGLPQEKYNFSLVSSFNDFHFLKPNPAYWAEVMAQLGWPQGPLLIVGDDYTNDIKPAASLGMPTYWISGRVSNNSSGNGQAHGSGRIDNLFSWIDSQVPEQLIPNFDHLNALTNILITTAPAIHTITKHISEKQWKFSPTNNDWCITEVLCHLRDTEAEVNLPRLHAVLSEDNAFITGVDTDIWAKERDYLSQEGSPALQSFMHTRAQTLQSIQNMGPEDWQRKARHTIFGPTTFQELVRIIARHDQLHLAQLLEIIADFP